MFIVLTILLHLAVAANEEQSSVMRRLNVDRRRLGSIQLPFGILMWENGEVPYSFNDDFPEQFRDDVRSALDVLATSAHPDRQCVKFREVPENDDEYHVMFKQDDPPCKSEFGHSQLYSWVWDMMSGDWFTGSQNNQEIHLTWSCMNNEDTIIHEMLHTLGFSHEHQRWDRDDYLELDWDKIEKAGNADQFTKIPQMFVDDFGEPFDYESIMLYNIVENGWGTMKDPSKEQLVRDAHGLSKSDIFELRMLFDCPIISEENCECEEKWTWGDSMNLVNDYCGNPDKWSGGTYCIHKDPQCGEGRGWAPCKPKNGQWEDGSLCGIGTTCDYCMHEWTYWYSKAMTACGYEPRWKDGAVCAKGTTCNACENPATFWYGKAITACGTEPKTWEDGSRCGLGTTCNICKNEATYWYSKAFTACGPEPCWEDGSICAKGTTCNACCNGSEHWWGKAITACGTEPCWEKGETCGWGTTCFACCHGNGDGYGQDCPWYWFGVCECK